MDLLITNATISAFVLFLVTCVWIHRYFAYWPRRNIIHIPPIPLVGNVLDLLLYRCCFGDQFKRLYNHAVGEKEPFVGIHVLHNHAVLLRDPELIRRVLVTDFASFSSRFETTDPVGDTMGSMNLFFAKYDVWRQIHQIFSPLFASGKVRQMYPLLQEIGSNLEQHLKSLPHDALTGSTITEVKEMCSLFTTDLIAALAFGIQANSLRNPFAEFRRMCIEVNEPRLKRIFHLFVMFFFPQLVGKYVSTHLYSEEYEQFMRNSVEYVMHEREKSGEKRNDLIDIFIALKTQRSWAGEINVEKLALLQRKDFFVAQAAFLLLAGFDTSSSTITFALYELARHPLIQHRLRAELKEALKLSDDGQLSYEQMQELCYLRQVIDEVLRLYPATSFLDRCCTAPNGCELKGSSDFKDRSLTVPCGMPVYISILGLHRDEKFWPEPNKFDPERFAPGRRQQIISSMTYLPFGSGPRGCMGSVLGLLQIKIGLVHILKNYTVRPCERTLKEMRFDPKTFVLAADGGTYLKFCMDPLISI